MAISPSTGFVKPEVWAAAVQAEFAGRVVLRQFAVEDTRLEGNPGEKVNYTKYNALTVPGDAAEGTALTPEALSSSADGSLTIKEVGKAVEITDRAQMTALGDPLGEARRQVGIVIARKIDQDLNTALATATQTVTVAGAFAWDTVVVPALAKFGDRVAEGLEPRLVIHSKIYFDMLKDATFRDISRYGNPNGINLPGFVGMFGNIAVIVSDLMTVTAGTPNTYQAFLIAGKPLVYLSKRAPLVETDRDILARTTIITTNVHYAVGLRNNADVVKISTQ